MQDPVAHYREYKSLCKVRSPRGIQLPSFNIRAALWVYLGTVQGSQVTEMSILEQAAHSHHLVFQDGNMMDLLGAKTERAPIEERDGGYSIL